MVNALTANSARSMAQWRRAALILSVAMAAVPARAEPIVLTCIAWGGSHTGRYTFEIDTEPCRVFWREIETALQIDRCQPPHIVARKPIAPTTEYIVEFRLDTGFFADHVPGWADRGHCQVAHRR